MNRSLASIAFSDPANTPAGRPHLVSSRVKSTALVTHWGPYIVDADEDENITVHPHPDDPDPSPIGDSLRHVKQHRITKPAVRQSWLEGGPGTRNDLRGSDPFVEVDWDTANALVAAELVRVRDEHGHKAIFGGSYGWASAGRFHGASTQLYRFLRHFGGYTDSWGTYSASAGIGIAPYIFGHDFYRCISMQTSWSVINDNTELFISFGGLRLTNTEVTYGGQGPHHTRGWMTKATENGMQFLNISPLRDDIGAEFGARWVHPRPGTDVALMAGLIHTLVVEGLHDEAFLNTRCHGWDRLEAYILGTSDGTPKSADWAAEITGLSADDIVAMAREMASKRTLINLSLSVQRQHHGEQSYWMGTALACALGQIGQPGGGIAFPFGTQGNVGSGLQRTRVPGPPVPPRPADTTVISVSRISELLESNGEDLFHFNGRADVYPDTRLVYWAGGNPFHHHQDLNRFVKAWQRPDTIIVHEPFWNPISKRADIVLPATTPLERSDLGGGDTLLLGTRAIIEPVGDSKDDYAIFCGLAEALGFGDDFSHGRTGDEWVEALYEEFRKDNPQAAATDEFFEKGTHHHDVPPMGSSHRVFLDTFVADPEANPLPSPSGRIELFSETIEGYEYDDCPPHPAWMEPFERVGGAGSDRFGLHLVSSQPSGRLHSQFDFGDVSQATKIDGREPCTMNPADAAERGIDNGDVVRLYNDRGACLAVAVLSDRVMSGAVQLSTGAWYDPDEHGMCKHGNPNVLTRDHGTSKLAQGPSAHTCIIEVERFEGVVPAITAYDTPTFVERGSDQ
ncbi:MAG: biotin/methionine sulfoxide reductase [Candidatus Poriferisodalaceae bacterium]|jgi:biotin/methionine sulfoxide reductase